MLSSFWLDSKQGTLVTNGILVLEYQIYFQQKRLFTNSNCVLALIWIIIIIAGKLQEKYFKYLYVSQIQQNFLALLTLASPKREFQSSAETV